MTNKSTNQGRNKEAKMEQARDSQNQGRNNQRSQGNQENRGHQGNQSHNNQNRQSIFGNDWKTNREHVRRQWNRLTDKDLDRINGVEEELIGRLEEVYGYSHEQAVNEVDTFLERVR